MLVHGREEQVRQVCAATARHRMTVTVTQDLVALVPHRHRQRAALIGRAREPSKV